MRYIPFGDLEKEQQELLLAAEETMEHAFNPYSHFFVGAGVRTAEGNIYRGANFENSAQGSICAERSALLAANAAGDRGVTSIAVIARGSEAAMIKPTTACGFCRQFIHDFSEITGKDIELIFSSADKELVMVTSIKELLPEAFGFLNAGIDLSYFSPTSKK